jgi:hypothetical protein
MNPTIKSDWSGSDGVSVTISATGDASLVGVSVSVGVGVVLGMEVEVKLDESMLGGDCLLVGVAVGPVLLVGFVDDFEEGAGLAGTPSRIAADGDAFCGSVTAKITTRMAIPMTPTTIQSDLLLVDQRRDVVSVIILSSSVGAITILLYNYGGPRYKNSFVSMVHPLLFSLVAFSYEGAHSQTKIQFRIDLFYVQSTYRAYLSRNPVCRPCTK